MSAINKQGKWNIPILLSYLFFLLFGLFLGYKLASEAYDYLKAFITFVFSLKNAQAKLIKYSYIPLIHNDL